MAAPHICHLIKKAMGGRKAEGNCIEEFMYMWITDSYKMVAQNWKCSKKFLNLSSFGIFRWSRFPRISPPKVF